MKNKRKIIVGVLVGFGILFLVLGFLYLSKSNDLVFDRVDVGSEPEIQPAPAPKPDHVVEPSPTRIDHDPTGLDSALPQQQLSSVDSVLEKMASGTIAFNVPATINIDDSPEIQLLLSLSETIDTLEQSIVEAGEKHGAVIKVSNRMQAHLTGHRFQITPITPEIQVVSKKEETAWKWEIYPKDEGTHDLHLTLTALLEIDGYSTPRAIKTFEEKIAVTVTHTQRFQNFFKNNWQWLWAAILVPIAGWLWKQRNRGKTN